MLSLSHILWMVSIPKNLGKSPCFWIYLVMQYTLLLFYVHSKTFTFSLIAHCLNATQSWRSMDLTLIHILYKVLTKSAIIWVLLKTVFITGLELVFELKWFVYAWLIWYTLSTRLQLRSYCFISSVVHKYVNHQNNFISVYILYTWVVPIAI